MLREFQNIHSALHPPQNHKFSKSTLCLFLQKNILKKQTDKIANNQQQLQQFFVSCDLEWGGAGKVACSSGTRERLRDVCHSAFVANPVSPSKLQGDVAEVARSLDPGLVEESVDSRTGAFMSKNRQFARKTNPLRTLCLVISLRTLCHVISLHPPPSPRIHK
jgi:hypothetical protein